MPRMTKAQARKRLAEAYDKVFRVALSMPFGTLTPTQTKNLNDAMGLITKVANSLK